VENSCKSCSFVWLLCVLAQFGKLFLDFASRELEALHQSSVEDVLGVRLVVLVPYSSGHSECECPLEYGTRTFVLQETYIVCEVVCLGSGKFSSAVPERLAIYRGLQEMRASDVEICLLCRDSERAAPNISRRLMRLSSFFNSAHVTVITNDSEDDSLAAMKMMKRLFGGPGQRNIAINVEGFSLRMTRPPAFSFRYPPKEKVRLIIFCEATCHSL
jgi:hypothetical protein